MAKNKKAKIKASKKEQDDIKKAIKDVSILKTEDRKKTVDKVSKLRGSKVLKVPDEEIVYIPISGSFNKVIEGLFFYLMEPMKASEILHSMSQIRKNFEGVKTEDVSNQTRALWGALTLLSEIHYQADAQGKLVEADENVGNLLQDLLHGVKGTEEMIATNIEKLHEESNKDSNED